MKLNRFLVAFAVALGAATFATDANAGLLGSLLSFDGNVDILQDESAGLVFDADSDGRIGLGDVLYGFFQISSVDGNLLSSTQSILGVYSLQIVGLETTSAGAPVLVMGATDASDAIVGSVALQNLLPGMSDLNVSKNSIVAVVENPGVGNPIDSGTLDIDVAGILGDITNAAGWAYAMTLGLIDANDFYQVRINPDEDFTGDPVSIAGLTDVANNDGLKVADYRIGASVEAHTFGSDTVFLKLPRFDFLGNSGEYDFTWSTNNTISAATGTGHDFRDDGDFRINAVPEPGTLALWAGMFLGLAGAQRVRNRRKADATA